MKRLKHDFKKGMAMALSVAMIAGLVPVMSGGTNIVKAADSTAGNPGTEPSVTVYATKDQLMGDTFKPNDAGIATNIGKLVFGKKSDGTTAQEWYILGKDKGIDGDNTIIFAASPIATGQKFNSSTGDKTYNYEAGTGYGDPSGSKTVNANHYGASDLRVKLQNMATDTSCFTTAEQNLMTATKVTTKDTKNNNVTYTTKDKLYALAAESYYETTIKAGSDNSTVLAKNYWSGTEWFWLRSPCDDFSDDALLVYPGHYAYYAYVGTSGVVQPASNLNLSSVLFASAATAASSETVEARTIADGTAMTLRLDGTGKNIGTVTYNTTTGDIKAAKDTTSQSVALVVQGNDGTDDWFYSKTIATSETINTSTIKSALALSSDIDLSACKIWLEITDTDEMIYAVNAEKEIESINTTYVTKEQLMTAFTPDANGTATTKGKLVFGKNSSGNVQEWYILGKDSGVSGDNTIIFAASPIATNQVFNSSTSKKTYGSTTVYASHYGASDLRGALQNMAANTSYFTTAEQGLMNATIVTTNDLMNGNTYTTPDKLYALKGDYNNGQYLWAGTDDSTVLAMSSYWSSGAWFWLRSHGDNSIDALCARPGSYVYNDGVYYARAVQPASNLNLSSVLFASAAIAASSDTAEAGIIASDKAMTLRLDGKDKVFGKVTYTADRIKAVKLSDTGNVTLVVQGNDGTNNWYYSKQITETETIKVSDIKTALSKQNISDVDLSKCKIWLESTDTDRMVYAVNATKVEEISSVEMSIPGNGSPEANNTLPALTYVNCNTTGVLGAYGSWSPEDNTAKYNTEYTATISLSAKQGYEFADDVTATIAGKTAVIKTNTGEMLIVTYTYPATAKDKLTSITTPQAITVASGTAYSAMNLPEQVNIVTEGNTVSSAQVTWNTTTPAGGSYDPSVLTEQTVTLNGTVTCPDSIDDNGVELTTTITITISAAGIVGAPTANPTATTYTENQSVTLTSSTEGATIYYTIDGSEPTIIDGTPAENTKQYTAPIAVTGEEGQSITTTIKAIAVKDRMQNSSVETFTYTIQIPVSKYAVTVTNGSGTGQYTQGETVTITANAAPEGQRFKEWTIESGNITLASSTSDTTTFVMPAGAVSVKANYEAIPTPVSYKILDGANSDWKQNTDGTVTIRGNGDFAKFVGVKVDGNTIDAKNYTAKEGSTIVTLTTDYLKTLSIGTHTFEIVWTDGSAGTNFSVSKNDSGSETPKDDDENKGDNANPTPDDKNKNDDSGSQTGDNQHITAPQTGDNSHPTLWISLLGASLIGLLATLYMRKKKYNE